MLFGLVGAFLAVLLIKELLIFLKRKGNINNYIKLLFLVTFTGSLSSLDLTENCAVISLSSLILMTTRWNNNWILGEL